MIILVEVMAGLFIFQEEVESFILEEVVSYLKVVKE
jgi:hypothetical protein